MKKREGERRETNDLTPRVCFIESVCGREREVTENKKICVALKTRDAQREDFLFRRTQGQDCPRLSRKDDDVYNTSLPCECLSGCLTPAAAAASLLVHIGQINQRALKNKNFTAKVRARVTSAPAMNKRKKGENEHLWHRKAMESVP